jgi:hypothetical protein
MRNTLQTLSIVSVSIALASGCVVINMPPDDAGSTTSPEGDGTTESTDSASTDEVSTDETETSVPADLPSEETESTTSDTDDTVDDTTDGADGTCCTCPVDGPSECWSWTMTAEQCEVALSNTLNVDTIFCVDGDQDTCSATCPA